MSEENRVRFCFTMEKIHQNNKRRKDIDTSNNIKRSEGDRPPMGPYREGAVPRMLHLKAGFGRKLPEKV
jgi:hypothetical protein